MHEPPSLPSTPEEAHLYLSPSHMAGKAITLSLITRSGISLATSSSQTSFADNASPTKRRKLSLLKMRKGQTQNGPLNAGKSSSRSTSGLNL